MSRIGFTGTRRGMTTSQWAEVERQIARYMSVEEVNTWHDGDCIGADDQAHKSVEKLMDRGILVDTHGHPCNLSDDLKAFNDFKFIYDPLPPLVRNRIIVEAVDVMIAAPGEFEEVIRGSGTWATIRYAKRQGRMLIIVWPDGTFEITDAPPSLLDE